MKLVNKMAIGILGLLLLVFVGNYLITLAYTKSYFKQQLESNAQDTATSLGLSLSQSTKTKDMATMLAMVEAVFDRGYFSLIEVTDLQSNVLVSRTVTSERTKVPAWFEYWVGWPKSTQTALIMNGWKQAGEVHVVGLRDYAYSALWEIATSLVKWYFVFAMISLAAAYIFIKTLLNPLKRVVQQAFAISRREFPIETHIPKSFELKQVTLAMNRMVLKVKALFEEQAEQAELYREQAYIDSLTGLGNRRFFMQQLSTLLMNEHDFHPGYLVLIMVDGLDEYNHHAGYQKGDEMIMALAKICKESWHPPEVSLVARISGSTFAIIFHQMNPALVTQRCVEETNKMNKALPRDMHLKVVIGASPFRLGEPITELLSQADLSLIGAREGSNEFIKSQDKSAVTEESLNMAIRDHLFTFSTQKITQTDRNSCLHQELFIRKKGADGQSISAGYFMPMAEKLNIAHLIDLEVIKAVKARSQKMTHPLAINISAQTITNPENRSLYLSRLKQFIETTSLPLFIEVSEVTVMQHFDIIVDFVKQLRQLNIGFGIDQAGVQFSSLDYLSNLTIDYLKLHPSLIHGIDEDQSRQFFLHYFKKTADTLDLVLIATQVESETQWESLQAVPIIWGQGRFISDVMIWD